MYKQYNQKPIIVKFNNIPKTLFVKIESIHTKKGNYGPYDLYVAIALDFESDEEKPIMFIPPSHLKMYFENALVAPMDGNIYKIEYLGKKNYINNENGTAYSKHTFKFAKVFVDQNPDGELIFSENYVNDPDSRTELDKPKQPSIKELSAEIKTKSEIQKTITSELQKPEV